MMTMIDVTASRRDLSIDSPFGTPIDEVFQSYGNTGLPVLHNPTRSAILRPGKEADDGRACPTV